MIKPIQVAIDISSLPYGRGVSRYTSNLVRGLSGVQEVALTLYGYSLRNYSQLAKQTRELQVENPKTQITLEKLAPTALNWMWKLRQHQVSKLMPHIDVFHSWDWLQPPDRSLPLVSTIHDLALLRFPDSAHSKILKMHQQAWKILKNRQHSQVIAVSQATKHDIVQNLGINPNRIHVIYEALPFETIRAGESLDTDLYDKLKAKLKLDKPYILFVGTREPRKNLDRLIQAWQPVAKDVDLLIAGDSGWDETDQKQYQHHPRFMGRVSEPELVVLYQEAEILAYPSLYEGFGLPILEAFYHGTPVLTSDNSGMKEVAGNAAELVEPTSIDSIHHGLTTLLSESESEQKKRLQKMVLRLQLFDWNRVARQTLSVYQAAVRALG